VVKRLLSELEENGIMALIEDIMKNTTALRTVSTVLRPGASALLCSSPKSKDAAECRRIAQYYVARAKQMLTASIGQHFLTWRSFGRGWPSEPSRKTVVRRKRNKNSSLGGTFLSPYAFFNR
jgi:hypothetical protein